MSATVRAPYRNLGEGGDYPVEMNYAVRIYNTPPQNEKIPDIGIETGTLKGGQRTNFHGVVPLLDGKKENIGKAEILKIISARPEFMPLEEIKLCGFDTIEKAVEYAKKEHGEEFARDGVLTIYRYKILQLNKI